MLREHFEKVLASDDKKLAEYILNWCALCIQHPEEKVPVVLALIGDQGSGKGTLGDLLLKIFGNHGLYVTHKNQLTGRFNNHLVNIVFIHADEVFFGGDKQTASILKAMITYDRIPVDTKYLDLYEAKNLIRFLVTTNEAHALHLDPDDRRYVIFHTKWIWKSEAGKGDHKAYFDKLWYEIEHDGAEGFLYDMLTRKLDGFNVSNIPSTVAKAYQKTKSLRGTARWWHDVLNKAEEPWSHANGIYEKNRRLISKDWMYDAYVEWTKPRMRSEFDIDSRETFWRIIRVQRIGTGILPSRD